MLEAKNYKIKQNILSRQILDDVTVIRIYFRDSGIFKYSRDELFAISDAIGKLEFYRDYLFKNQEHCLGALLTWVNSLYSRTPIRRFGCTS